MLIRSNTAELVTYNDAGAGTTQTPAWYRVGRGIGYNSGPAAWANTLSTCTLNQRRRALLRE